jgi:hypothetical protein
MMEAKVLHKSGLGSLSLPSWLAAFSERRRYKNNNCTLRKSVTLGGLGKLPQSHGMEKMFIWVENLKYSAANPSI